MQASAGDTQFSFKSTAKHRQKRQRKRANRPTNKSQISQAAGRVQSTEKEQAFFFFLKKNFSERTDPCKSNDNPTVELKSRTARCLNTVSDAV